MLGSEWVYHDGTINADRENIKGLSDSLGRDVCHLMLF